MVDLSGGQDGPIEHGFSNSVFIVPTIIFVTLSDKGEELSIDSLSKLSELLSTVELSDEDKQSFSDVLNEQMKKYSGFVKPGVDVMPGANILMQVVLIIAFVIMLTLFAFFGYKLYQSLTEKERKRDEKRKQKQMKKKK
ncbi:hypothetical protein FQA39_LY04695 [Lamprigera yunnana]|nr:hypothetical protein FQA39_LY04695 [Lamprigera yunnana]